MIGLRPLRHPKPIIRRPQRPRGKALTVCIAASCDDGKFIVSATDGLLTLGDITADAMSGGKMVWINGWQFMFAGEPSNAQMIFDEMHELGKEKPLARDNIKRLLSRAFKKRMSDCLSSLVLSPFDMTMEEFKKEGLKMFGEREFSRLAKTLEDAAYQYTDQILVTGWGKSAFATMLYQVDAQGDRDAKYEGIAAIGSGRNVALSTLLLLGQSRHRSLVETIYNVAAAKFSSEKSYEQGVGQSTLMYIQWKRTKEDQEGGPVGLFLQDFDIDKLREIWEEYGKPRFPEPARRDLYQIIQQKGIQLSQAEQIRTMVATVKQFLPKSNPQKS
jgi:ATP-dependent protease HslVU (ClpYQ) peptidase subunit